MKINRPKLTARLGIYLAGLIVLAFGITLAVNSNLGVSPVTSLPYVISQVLNITLGTCTILVYTCYIFLQMILKGGKFQPALLLQLVFSTVFGYLVDGTKLLLGDFVPATYFGRLAMLAASIVLIGFSLVLYIDVKIAPMPPEGLVTCIADKLGKVVGIREGTIITALLVGKLTGFFRKLLTPFLQKTCF